MMEFVSRRVCQAVVNNVKDWLVSEEKAGRKHESEDTRMVQI